MKSLKNLEEIIKKHRKKIVKLYKIKEIGIFGSYIRGEQSKTSDVDILVEFEEIPDLFKDFELERYLEELLEVKVDLVRKKAIRDELRDIILKEVVLI